MAPRAGSTLQSSFPGLWKYPTYRKEPIQYAELWMEGKKVDDNTGGLWRVHDALYDFSDWIYKHPGGSDWLKLTKVHPIEFHLHSTGIIIFFLRIFFLFYNYFVKNERAGPIKISKLYLKHVLI
jgi:hypothetical protein